MALSDYAAALKQGRRKYHSAVTKGEYPYLPVLDDILSYTEVAANVSLGRMDVPLSKIVGTKTAGRTDAFAGNFMPLLPEKSEFAGKWSSLYEHQVTDGIRDPIVAYEFMNRFYVQEGNKRVSVMKYLGAYSIGATVTRIVPKKTDDKETRLYYEYMDFFEVSHNCEIWFTREGSYKKLLKLMEKKSGEMWSDEEQTTFRSVYSRFSDALEAVREEKTEVSVSDIFLVYLEIYGYRQAVKEKESDMRGNLQKMRMEIRLADQGSQVELVENPEKKKASLRSILMPVTPEMLKIAFIYPKTKDTSGWTYAHELGRMHLEQAFGGKLRTMAIDRADADEEVENAIELAIASGCNLIFTIAIQMVNASVRCAIHHPKVKIYNCSVKMPYSSICTYYARMYESKFLVGAIASALSRSDRLGYVADYPIYGTIANINAFALGARMINPYAKVYLEWSRTKEQDAGGKLAREGVVFISGDDMITPQQASREYGLYTRKEDGALVNLATPVWHWGKFYERIVRNICKGSTEANVQKGKKAVNYWWGMSADVIDVICSKNMPAGTGRLIEFLKKSICEDRFHPFDGVIRSQDGAVRCEDGRSLDADDIIRMDWLADNVVGHIPGLEELTEEARALVQLQGIKIDETEAEE